MYISDSGGCCDCGDSTSWKPSGFCPHHRTATQAPTLTLPPDESAFLQALVHTVMRIIGLHCGLLGAGIEGAALLPQTTWEGAQLQRARAMSSTFDCRHHGGVAYMLTTNVHIITD